jgi:hypothetical protein
MLGIVQDITEKKMVAQQQDLTIRILEKLNRAKEGPDAIQEILGQIKEFTGLEAVGIRLKENKDYPYFVAKGFPSHFIEAEKHLCSMDENGEMVFDSKGNPILECMCGSVIMGNIDPALSFFTEGGSFWTNSTTQFMASMTDSEWQTNTRNMCNREGFESVALIPLRSGQEIVGLLQLNDRRPNRFDSSMINFFEKIGNSIGIAFSGFKGKKRTMQNEIHYHR